MQKFLPYKLKTLTVPKDFNQVKSNEDFAKFNPNEPASFALSDGATESYNSKLWAKLLVKNFVDSLSDEGKIEITKDWLITSIKQYASSHNFAEMSWYQTEAFDKGSFATFVALRRTNSPISSQRDYTFYLFGDSFFFIFKRNNEGQYVYQELFPIPNFDAAPLLLSSKLILNEKINLDNLSAANFREVSFNENECIKVIFATDALANWIANWLTRDCGEANIKKHSKLLHFFEKTSLKKYKRFISLSRYHKSMKVDDSTFSVLEL